MVREVGKTRSANSGDHKAFDIFYNTTVDTYRMYLGLDARNKNIFVSVTNDNNIVSVTKYASNSLTSNYVLVGNLTAILTEDDCDIPF